MANVKSLSETGKNPQPPAKTVATTQQPAAIPDGAVRLDSDINGWAIVLAIGAVLCVGLALWRWQRRDMGFAAASGALALLIGAASICSQFQDPSMKGLDEVRKSAVVAGFACLVNVGCGAAYSYSASWAQTWAARDLDRQRLMMSQLAASLPPASEVANAADEGEQ